MGLIYFFDRHIKPIMLKGTQILNPANTGVLTHGVSCVRQGDVNLWLYTKSGHTIAIDAGHINEPHIDRDFKAIGIDPATVRHVLLTHADVDHCGGIDPQGNRYLYPNAKVYLGSGEKCYLDRTLHRMVKLHKKIYNCVQLRPGYHLLEDGETLDLEGISVRCISVPGHTAGPMCYIEDDQVLFSGDCQAVNQEGGYAFWDFFCQFPEQNKKSLLHLRQVVREHPIVCACTGHSGFVTDIDHLFAHIDVSAPFGKKVVFDKTAPKDVCKRK